MLTAGFDNDEIKDILYYISTIRILILSILFQEVYSNWSSWLCVCVWIKMFYNNAVILWVLDNLITFTWEILTGLI